MEVKYVRNGMINICLIDYENVMNICYGCGTTDHKFDLWKLNTKYVASKWKIAEHRLFVG